MLSRLEVEDMRHRLSQEKSALDSVITGTTMLLARQFPTPQTNRSRLIRSKVTRTRDLQHNPVQIQWQTTLAEYKTRGLRRRFLKCQNH